MKTAILINTFVKMSNYDLKELSRSGTRIVAITSWDEAGKFHEKYGNILSHIYCSPKSNNGSLEKIDYNFSLEVVKNELDKNDFVRIICQSEDNLLLAARLREAYCIPGMGLKKTSIFRDKVLMKDALKKENIRIPKYRSFSVTESLNIGYFDQLKNQFKLPFVLKPTSLLGSLGVLIINTENDFKNAINGGMEKTEYEVEEFISGSLFHCDTIRKNKETLFSACCQYTNPNFDFQLGKSIISFPLMKGSSLEKMILEFNDHVLDTLEFDNGVTHHEFFITSDGEIIFLEIAARSPGGIITPMYRNAYNIGFEDTDFKIQMEIPFQLNPSYNCHYLSGIFPIASSGTVEKLINPILKSQFNIKWLVNPGDHVSSSKSVRDKSAIIEAWNTNYDDLLQDFEYLKNYQCIEVCS